MRWREFIAKEKLTAWGKKGLEMQQLILILLAILLLVFVGAWFFGLNEKSAELLDKFGSLLGW